MAFEHEWDGTEEDARAERPVHRRRSEFDLTLDEKARLEQQGRVEKARPKSILTFQDALRGAAYSNHFKPGSLAYVTDYLLKAADEIDRLLGQKANR